MNSSLRTQTPLEKISRLVDELHAAYEQLLGGETVAALAEIRVLVGEWNSEVIPTINARIARCRELVRRGLRDEAIGHAIEQPDLFEATKLLDLERFGRSTYAAWMEAGRACGLTAPVPPDLSKMAEVVAAQDQLACIHDLISRWRRLNFQRAELPARIALLRELHEQDSHEIWSDLLEKHESSRLLRIKADFARIDDHVRQGAVNLEHAERGCEEYLDELRGNWSIVKPDLDLIDQAARLAAEMQQRRADRVLDQLLPELEATWAELATDRSVALKKLSRLCEKWRDAIAERGVCDRDDSRIERARPIVDFVNSRQEYMSLIREVGHRVAERPATLPSRIAWIHELLQMMDRIDDAATRLTAEDVDAVLIGELSDRVANLVDDVRREERAKRFFAVSMVGGVLIGTALVAWAVFARGRHREAVAAVLVACEETIKQVEAGSLDVKAPVADLAPAVQKDPQVLEALDRIARAVEARDRRRDLFAEQMAAIREALDGLKAAARPDPLAPWPKMFTAVAELLDRVQEARTAVTEDELAALEMPAALLRATAKDYTAAADDAFEDRLRQVEADLVAVQLMIADDLQQATAALDDATASYDALRALSTAAACPPGTHGFEGRRIVSSSIALLASSDSKVARLISDLRERCVIVAAIEAREREADTLLMSEKYAEYADAIRRIADDLGPGVVARDYAAVANDHADWTAISEWRRFVGDLVEPPNLSPEHAETLLKRLRGFDPNNVRLRAIKDGNRWVEPWLERVVSYTTKDLDRLKLALIKILESQHGEGIDGVIWEQDRLPYPRYYCLLKDRPLADRKRTLRYLIGRPDAQGEWPKKPRTYDPTADEVADSPQKSLAIRCKAALEAPSGRTSAIERAVLEVILESSRDLRPPPGTPDIDPCLHAILVRFLVARVGETCPAVAELLPRSLAETAAGNAPDGQPLILKGVDNEVFTAALDPERQDDGQWVRANREKCAEFVQLTAREAGEAALAIEARERDLINRLHSIACFRCVGRLRRRAEGGWAVSGGDSTMRAGKRLLVVGDRQKGVDMIPCVQCDADGEIPAGSHVAARAGDPVFVEVSADKES